MIKSRSPKRIVALTARCSSQSSASCSSSCWCSAVSAASCPSDSACRTSARRSESLSISSLISSRFLMTSFNVEVRRPIPESGLVVTKLLEPVLVDPEIVRQLVEHGHPDLLLELGRVREGLDERPPVDGDLVGQVGVGLPESEEVRLLRILLL